MPLTKQLESILAIYRAHGHRQYGETVTELQHALQTATFARQSNEPDAVVAAALLHDFGHLLHSAKTGSEKANRSKTWGPTAWPLISARRSSNPFVCTSRPSATCAGPTRPTWTGYPPPHA